MNQGLRFFSAALVYLHELLVPQTTPRPLQQLWPRLLSTYESFPRGCATANMAPVRRAPYKDFLQPSLQRRFSSTTTILLGVAYIEAVILAVFRSPKAVFSSWWSRTSGFYLLSMDKSFCADLIVFRSILHSVSDWPNRHTSLLHLHLRPLRGHPTHRPVPCWHTNYKIGLADGPKTCGHLANTGGCRFIHTVVAAFQSGLPVVVDGRRSQLHLDTVWRSSPTQREAYLLHCPFPAVWCGAGHSSYLP